MRCQGLIIKRDLDSPREQCARTAGFTVNNRKTKKAACRMHLSEMVEMLLDDDDPIINVRRLG